MVHIPTTVKNKNLVAKRRRQLVLAAIKLFSKKGFHKTTLKDLAEEAGLSHGNIYDYVGSKEDIFYLIHDFLERTTGKILRRSIENVNDPLEKLRRIVRGEFNLMDQWADAVLLLYQETHILEGELLRNLLKGERQHLEMFEVILDECITKKQIKPCNVRLVSNLIKSMIDSWTVKRWDLRNHTSLVEAENTIMEIVSDGLISSDSKTGFITPENNLFSGRTALMVNNATFLGQMLCKDLSAKGIQIIKHKAQTITKNELENLENEYVPIDFYVQDFGIGITENPSEKIEKNCARKILEENLRTAYNLAHYLVQRMDRLSMNRIAFIAPWAWDFHADSIGFDIAKGGAISLAKSLSKKLARANVNVNCIVPGYIRGIRPFKIEKKLKKELIQNIPSGRLGDSFDVTNAVSFLLQDESKYITGQVLYLTGGQ